MQRLPLLAATALAAVVAIAPSAAQTRFVAGVVRDPAVPTLRAVTGHDFGEEISDHAETVDYLRALAAGSDRARLERFGASWEGRSLNLLIVSSPENLARLDAIRSDTARLAFPDPADAEQVDALCAELPATTWLAYSVHGDEISCTDAALWTAWHLCSAQGDELVDTILRESIVVIDPLQNPDGRERFVFNARQTRGRWADAEPDAAVRDQPWPGGRSNHYGCDMNRDWFGLTQPETRARVAMFQKIWPVMFVDLHEMGTNSSYYFGPPALPHNPEITDGQHAWLLRYGKENARWFDRRGFDYFTREQFDAFYPGYGDSWPTFHGAIAMTYEQASSRGMVVEREDGRTMRYVDTVERHAIASLATCETTARNREAVLRRFLDDRRSAIAAGRSGTTREFVLEPTRDAGRAERLAKRLAFQGIAVRRLTAPARNPSVRPHGGGEAAERTFPAGSFVVRLDQAAGRLVRVLLSKHQDMNADFVEDQLRREDARQGSEIYDVTAWSLPLVCGVDCFETGAFTEGASEEVDHGGLAPVGIDVTASADAPRAQVAYVVPAGRNDTAVALASLLRSGHRVHCAGEGFRIGERTFAAGSLVVKVAENGETVHALVHALDSALHLDVASCDSSWVDEGVHFGSNKVKFVQRPKIAIAWDRPASPYSAGSLRYVLEWRYGVEASVVRTARLASADLDRFDVLVLPDGSSYGDVLRKAGAERIAQWVHRGGTLVTLGGGATRWLTGTDVALLATEPEKRDKHEDGAPAAAAERDQAPGTEPREPHAPHEPAADPDVHKRAESVAYDYERAIVPDEESPARTPGAILRVELDPEHWVAFGLGPFVDIVSTDRDVYAPLRLDKGRNVGVFAPRETLLQSGLAWDDKLDQLARKPFVVHQPHGDGHVIAFAEDPNLRGFTEGTDLLLLNAILLGPSF